MAIVRGLQEKVLDRSAKHSEVEATVSTVQDENGEKFVQIDTYGSSTRAMPGKVSQSLRLSQAAFEQLMQIGTKYF